MVLFVNTPSPLEVQENEEAFVTSTPFTNANSRFDPSQIVLSFPNSTVGMGSMKTVRVS